MDFVVLMQSGVLYAYHIESMMINIQHENVVGKTFHTHLMLYHIFLVPRKAASTVHWHLYCVQNFKGGTLYTAFVLCSRRSWKG